MTEPARLVASPDFESFYKAFAVAVLMWQEVEHSLFALMFALSSTQDLTLVGETYYARHSFGPKLALVHQAALAKLQGGQLAEWKALRERLGAGSKDRNWLAHATSTMRFHPDNTFDLVLMPAAFVPKSLRQHRTTYDAQECLSCMIRFRDLAQEVEAFNRLLA